MSHINKQISLNYLAPLCTQRARMWSDLLVAFLAIVLYWRSLSMSGTSFFLSLSGWHTLSSHASAEASLTGWSNAQPQGRD